jgi:hypothetical protein
MLLDRCAGLGLASVHAAPLCWPPLTRRPFPTPTGLHPLTAGGAPPTATAARPPPAAAPRPADPSPVPAHAPPRRPQVPRTERSGDAGLLPPSDGD